MYGKWYRFSICDIKPCFKIDEFKFPTWLVESKLLGKQFCDGSWLWQKPRGLRQSLFVNDSWQSISIYCGQATRGGLTPHAPAREVLWAPFDREGSWVFRLNFAVKDQSVREPSTGFRSEDQGSVPSVPQNTALPASSWQSGGCPGWVWEGSLHEGHVPSVSFPGDVPEVFPVSPPHLVRRRARTCFHYFHS